MKSKKLLIWMFIAGISTAFIQCKDSGDELVPDDENELITTVRLNFRAGMGAVQTFSYQDADGDGGNAPTKFDTIRLNANEQYTLEVEFLDESKTPVDNITDEIKEHNYEHLIVYTPNPASLFAYSYGDKDENNYPVGLTGTAKTGIAGDGKLKVQLRHQPNSKNGTITPGSDDVNLDFVLEVK